jgi:hypothetical protein
VDATREIVEIVVEELERSRDQGEPDQQQDGPGARRLQSPDSVVAQIYTFWRGQIWASGIRKPRQTTIGRSRS